jgi:hypothetical protein
MKRVILTFIILFTLNGIIKAQYIYNRQHKAICMVQTLLEETYDFYCGGLKSASVRYDLVYDGSGNKVGRLEKDIIYDESNNVICTIKGKKIYSGGKKAAYVKNNIVYDGGGNRLVSLSGISMMQLAVYIYFIAY